MNLLPSLSLGVLSTLDSLLRTRSVTKTAIELGQTQSAVSLTLKKIRGELGDQLLIRSGSGLVLTARAQNMAPRLHHLLNELSSLLADKADFHAVTTKRVFTIAVADCAQPFFLPQLITHLKKQAPHASLRVRPITRDFDYSKALQDGSLDLVVGNWPDPPGNLRMRPLFDDAMVCLARQSNPVSMLQKMDLKTYMEQQHVAPEPHLPNELGPVDGALNKLGLARNITITVPEFAMAGYVVASTDLIFTSSTFYAEYYADLLELKIIAAPDELDSMRFYILWHECMQSDAAVNWLKSQIVTVAQQFSRAA